MGYSIIQWGSGNVSSQVIAAIAQRRDLKLKGVFVYREDNVGRDAGDIAGIGKIGVAAANDVKKIPAMKSGLKTIYALLAPGKNVISTVAIYSKVYGASVMKQLAVACRTRRTQRHTNVSRSAMDTGRGSAYG